LPRAVNKTEADYLLVESNLRGEMTNNSAMKIY